MGAEDVVAEVGGRVPPHRVGVVGLALRVVVLDEQPRALQPVVVRGARLDRPGPGQVDGVQRGVIGVVRRQAVRDPAEVPGVATLGPDPLAADFTVDTLAGLLAGRRTQVKGVLRDQRIIAGIGNAYSDEVLHAAKMSPFKIAASMTPADVATLYDAIKTTLTEAVERSAGLAAADLKGEKKSGLRVHGRTGQACPVCGDTVREVSFADSALQYCPTCQTGGKPLADRRLSRLLK